MNVPKKYKTMNVPKTQCNMLIEVPLLEKIDKLAEKEGVTRTAWSLRVLREAVERGDDVTSSQQ